MQRQLFLLRHANAHSSAPGGDDHERRLDAAGIDAARRAGRYLARNELHPGLAICSSARRAVETFDYLGAELAPTPRVQIEKSLYLASREELLARLTQVEDTLSSLLVVAHSPGLGALAHQLAGAGDAYALRRLGSEFPTCTLVGLRFEQPSWRNLAPGIATLIEFTTPRDLL
ncbi:MAG: histidine phosphatase family protein [Myxococcota bacterium]